MARKFAWFAVYFAWVPICAVVNSYSEGLAILTVACLGPAWSVLWLVFTDGGRK